MENASRKNLIETLAFITLIGGAMTFGLWFFEKDKQEIAAVMILSVLICVSLLFLVLRKYEKLSEHPVFSLILLTAYLIMGIMLCFPNSTMSAFGLFFIVVIPVAGFSGLSFSMFMLLGCFGIVSVLDGQINIENIMYALFALISCFQIYDGKKGRIFIKRFAVSTVIQAIITLLFYGICSDRSLVIHSVIVILLYLAVLTVIALIMSYNVAFWAVFDYGFEEETPIDNPEAVAALEKVEKELSLDVLCKEDNYYSEQLRIHLPKCFEKAKPFAELCSKAAGVAGADTKLVYSMAFYKDLVKLKAENESTQDYINKLLLPEKLKKALINENIPNWHPSDFEEIIVFVGFNIVSTLNYVKKNKLDVSAEKIVDNTCTLLLKKGYARDCMISMASFHRMKQGFSENVGKL